MKTFKGQHDDLIKQVAENLCLIPDASHLLPHTVYLEDVGADGAPEYNKYQLLEIRKDGGCSLLDCNGIRIDEHYSLTDINLEWLITIWERHLEMLIEGKGWREDAIEFLQEHTQASMDDIAAFCDSYWQNLLPYTENLTQFNRYLKENERNH